MTGRPKVSIITATYNALESLKDTAASIEAQTYQDWEHVVVDGASTDGTQDWLAESSGIRWLSEPDSGIADALNKGIEMATGEWILVLQAADTFLRPTSLDEATDRLASDSEVVCFDVAFRSDAGIRRLMTSGLSPRLNWKPLPHQGAFTKRDLFDELGGFDPSYSISMDYEFFMRAYRAGIRSHVEHEVVTVMPGTGVSSQRDWASLALRFREERSVHRRYCSSLLLRAVYGIYWPLYLTYRWSRALLSGHDIRLEFPAQ